MTRTRKAPPKAPDCTHCYGKGLSAFWHDHGTRVPIGAPLTSDTEPAMPCDRCQQPVNNGQKRTHG